MKNEKFNENKMILEFLLHLFRVPIKKSWSSLFQVQQIAVKTQFFLREEYFPRAWRGMTYPNGVLNVIKLQAIPANLL